MNEIKPIDKTYVIGLNLIHGLNSDFQFLNAFEELYQECISENSFNQSSFWSSLFIYGSLGLKYERMQKEIDDYKTGETSTDTFLENLLKITLLFSLKAENFLDKVYHNLFEDKDKYISLKNVNDISELKADNSLILKKALIEKA